MYRVKQTAELCGWLAYHTHDSRRSDGGFPDLILAKPPWLLVFEAKKGKKEVRAMLTSKGGPAQLEWIRRFGAVTEIVAAVITPDDEKWVRDLIRRRA